MTTKQKIGLTIFIISILLNVYSFTLVRFANMQLYKEYYREGYADGIKRGIYKGFEQGLKTGRNCITNGVKGECEGKVDLLIELP